MLSNVEIEQRVMQELYPEGETVILNHMEDKQAPPKGTKGVICGIDADGGICVSWETGSRLKLYPDADDFELNHGGKIKILRARIPNRDEVEKYTTLLRNIQSGLGSLNNPNIPKITRVSAVLWDMEGCFGKISFYFPDFVWAYDNEEHELAIVLDIATSKEREGQVFRFGNIDFLIVSKNIAVSCFWAEPGIMCPFGETGDFPFLTEESRYYTSEAKRYVDGWFMLAKIQSTNNEEVVVCKSQVS